ncbi:MAG TPA: hypothetical protein VNM47_15880 [Terriglobia bacterium]|nr:hypothetical protein [Terriglobia bacterium]
MTTQIDDYVKRPMRYQNIDGLEELGIGLLWIILPLLEFFNKTAASGSIWHGRTTLFVCVAAVTVALLYGHKALKKRFTFPRTGYVKYRQTRTRVLASLLVAGAVAIVVAIATVFVLRLLEPRSSQTVGPVLASVAWGLFYIFITRMDAAWRWAVLVLLVAAPPALAVLPLGRLWLGNSPIVLIGVIYFVSGAITLALYLRQNPVPKQVVE